MERDYLDKLFYEENFLHTDPLLGPYNPLTSEVGVPLIIKPLSLEELDDLEFRLIPSKM